MYRFKSYFNNHKAFFAFLFVISIILSLKNQLLVSSSWQDFTYHADAPFWIFLMALLIFIIISSVKKKRSHNVLHAPNAINYLGTFLISLLLYMFLANTMSLGLSITFNNFDRNYGSILQFSRRLSTQLIDFFVFGSISLAYLFSKENSEYIRSINNLKVSEAQARINQLQKQLNPHFLFNNLNTLDQLIWEDQHKASEYLTEFAEVYRYTLHNTDKQLISLQEELVFAKSYFDLLEHKYENSYKLQIDDSVKYLAALVPPFCLQLLVENAVLHNIGTPSRIVTINISAADHITVENNKIAGKRTFSGNGKGLKNLSSQFELLSERQIKKEETENYFIVKLPIIKEHS